MGTENQVSYALLSTKNKLHKRRKTKTPFLCDELIFQILVWLPADVLYNTMRYVCTQWFDIIDDTQFVKKQLLLFPHISAGLFFQCYKECDCYFALFKRWGAVSKLCTLPCSLSAKSWYHFYPEMISNLIVVDACERLILVQNKTTRRISVANPLSKQLLTLPPINYKYESRSTSLSLGRARSTMEHKVVYVSNVEGKQRCGVITLGKDYSWRLIYAPTLSSFYALAYSCILHRVGSFMYWPYCIGSGSLVTFDMECERFYISNLPKAGSIKELCQTHLFVKGGDTLSCLIGSDDTTSWEVWVSQYNKIVPDWKKTHVIDFLPQIHKLRRVYNFVPSARA